MMKTMDHSILLLAVLAAVMSVPSVLARDADEAEEKVPLALELPKPMFVGTPIPAKIANLEKPLGRARPDFYVPKGTVNIGAGKAITGSDDFPVIGELEMVTDGDKAGSEGSYVELGPGSQYVQIDLAAPHAIHAILVWHYHAQARAYHDVIVQVSDDPDFIDGVTTVFNNDHDNSAGMGEGQDKAYIETSEGRLIDAKGATGRYVRLYSSGNTANDMNHYVEVEVFGTPAS